MHNLMNITILIRYSSIMWLHYISEYSLGSIRDVLFGPS